MTLFRSITRRRPVAARLPAPQLGAAWRQDAPEGNTPGKGAFTASKLDARFGPCGAPPVRRRP